MAIKDIDDPEELRRYAEDFEVIGQYLRHLRSARLYTNAGKYNMQEAVEELHMAQRIWEKQLPYWAKEMLIKEI